MKRGWLGIDAGGSRTRARVVTPEGGRGAGEAGPANWTTLGSERCTRELVRAAAQALQAAELAAEGLDGACVSLAGYYPPWHEAEARAALGAKLPAARLQIVPDLIAAWAGASGGSAGIVVVAGTGAVAYGRDPVGREARAGGWGPLFGDEGGGYWIGCEALRAISRALDGRGPATTLQQELLVCPSNSDAPRPGGTAEVSPGIHAGERGTEHTQVPEGRPSNTDGIGRTHPLIETENDAVIVAEALRGFYRDGAARDQVATLARAVARHAAAGDPAAREILARAAAELGALIAAVARRLRWESGPVPVAAVGGVMQAGPPLREPLERWLAAMLPAARWKEPDGDPLDGALLLAREAGPP